MQYRGLKDYVQRQKSKSYLNGKESFILRGATSLLRRIEADRRSVLPPFLLSSVLVRIMNTKIKNGDKWALVIGYTQKESIQIRVAE